MIELLTAIIFVLLLIIAIQSLITYKLVTNLSEKIALPIYNEQAKKTMFVRSAPEAKTAEVSSNLEDRSDLVDIDDVEEDDLYQAALRGGRPEVK